MLRRRRRVSFMKTSINEENVETTWHSKIVSDFVCLVLIIIEGKDYGEEIRIHYYQLKQIVSTTSLPLIEGTNCSRGETEMQ